jgi:glutamine amidotransferase
MSVAIVNYGSGNLHSAHKAFERAARAADYAGAIVVTNDPEAIRQAERVVLPGVGAFADCRRGLDAIPGMIDALNEAVRQRGAPFLGICVGMQLLATRGLEHVTTPGLGWIAGDVAAIEPLDPALKVPHMGWNTLDPARPHPLLEGIPTGNTGWHAYFVHSYAIKPTESDETLARTNYGGDIVAMVGRDNIAGTQFHPEKSQKLGLGLIANFLRWRP